METNNAFNQSSESSEDWLLILRRLGNFRVFTVHSLQRISLLKGEMNTMQLQCQGKLVLLSISQLSLAV